MQSTWASCQMIFLLSAIFMFAWDWDPLPKVANRRRKRKVILLNAPCERHNGPSSMIGQGQFSNEFAHHICPGIAFRRSSLLKSGFCFQHRTPACHLPLPHAMHCVIHPLLCKKAHKPHRHCSVFRNPPNHRGKKQAFRLQCRGHSLKNLGPSQKTLRPPGVSSWLRAWQKQVGPG